MGDSSAISDHRGSLGFSTMISSLEKAGEWQLALRFFHSMALCRVQPNVIRNLGCDGGVRLGWWFHMFFLDLFGMMRSYDEHRTDMENGIDG